MGSEFPAPLLPLNSLRKDPYWAAALSSAPSLPLRFWNGDQAGERFLARWKTGGACDAKKCSQSDIHSQPARSSGSLNEARLWHWDGESTPEEIRRTTRLTLWLSCRGIERSVYSPAAVSFFVSRCLHETSHHVACKWCWWLINLYFLPVAESDYPIHTWWQSAWWASVFVRLFEKEKLQTNLRQETFQSDEF